MVRCRSCAVLLLGLWIQPAMAEGSRHHDEQNDPSWSQADAIWGADEMADARQHARHEMGGMRTFFVMADRFEFQSGSEERLLWDFQGWYGGDINKFWLKSEGEYLTDESELEDAEWQALWSRAISAYWNLQTGVRYDFEPSGLAHGVVGFQGLAPYWWEIDAAAFVSQDGDLTARVEAEYDLLLTQRLVLQPRAELNLSASDVPERGLGSGITNMAIGLRLRYEVVREFAPYVGLEWQRSFGETADWVEADGGTDSDWVWVIGLRAWF